MVKKLIFLCLLSFNCLGQKNINWDLLSRVEYSREGWELNGYARPSFPPSLQQLEGKEVLISGYLVPIDPALNMYALSRYPLATCFFCGKAGPETVMEIVFLDYPGRLVTDRYVILKGILRLNDSDSGRLYYRLENARFHG